MKLNYVIIAFLVVVGAVCLPSWSVTTSYLVERVIDGDTLVLANGKVVRLLCVDTPEIGELGYLEAKNLMKGLVEGKYVRLNREIDDKDKYDRLLRYVYVEDVFINKLLLDMNYAEFMMVPPNNCDALWTYKNTTK